MSVALSREERETIINFNEAESIVNVFTYNPKWQRRVKEMGIKPIRTEGLAREYEFPKKWLRLPVKPREFTPAERQAARKRFQPKKPPGNSLFGEKPLIV